MNNIEALVAPGLYPTPQWFPQSMDSSGQWVRMVRFEEEDYRQAPFLDARGLREGMIQGWVPWSLLADRSRPEHHTAPHWIFHISHVGSTLVSRLLGECGDTLCLREPPLLKSLFHGGTSQANQRLPVMRGLMSRRFRESQRVVVKATSGLNDIAVPLVGPAAQGGKALFMSIPPQAFLVGRLSRGRHELARRAPGRFARLKRQIPQLDRNAASASDARVAAMSWACEATSLEQAMERIGPERSIFLDFESFLREPSAGLAHLAGHFGIACDPSLAARVVSSPIMRRNAKGRGEVIMTDMRRQEEAETLDRERKSISDALGWLDRQRSLSPLIDRACARFET